MKTAKGSRLRWGAGAASILMCGALVAIRTAAQSPTADAVPKLQENARIVNSLDGAKLYTAYCAVCHGAQGKGDGPMAKILTAKTPDLTRLAQRHGGKFPRAQVDGTISGEVASAGHGTREMPVWGPIFSQVSWDMDLGRVRIDNLARYLESVQEK